MGHNSVFSTMMLFGLRLRRKYVCRKAFSMIVIRDERDGTSKSYDAKRFLVDNGSEMKASLRLVGSVHIMNLRLSVYFDGARVKGLAIPLVEIARTYERTLGTSQIGTNFAESIDRMNSIVK